MKKKEGFSIQINFTNRWLYTFIVMGILMIMGVGVYAWANPTTGVGHDLSEIEPCGDEQILQMSGTDWVCVDMAGGLSTNPLYVEGAITAPEGKTLRDNAGGWVRTYGNTGWYSQTHGGGWYMTDSSWLRAYGNKGIYTSGQIRGGTLKVSGASLGNVGSSTQCTSSQYGEIRRCMDGSYSDICACVQGAYGNYYWKYLT